MNDNRTPMTKQGAERLKLELNRLKSVERPDVINAIAEARAHGDLKENAEYHAAREKQSHIEGRIHNLEAKLANCQVIDVTTLPKTGELRVVFGATVTLRNIDSENEVTYQIVGIDEADIKERKISITSPMARAMIGKYVGDEIHVNTPQGVSAYEVTHVDYI